jgi:hypothetical protein
LSASDRDRHFCKRNCDDVEMSRLSTEELIDRAEAVLRPRRVGDRWFGDVAAAIEADSGAIYLGV